MLEVTRSLVNRKFRAALLLQSHGGTV